MKDFLQVSSLFKSIKDKDIVKDVSMTLHPNEIVGLLGPNGAGKTTTFYLIAGIEKKDGGAILLNGDDISNLNLAERSKYGLAYLPQEKSIFQELSVEDNLRVSLELKGVTNQVAIADKIESILELMRLKRFRYTQGMFLSGGECRRTEIARLLCQDPKYLLLDEPFAGIDPISVRDTQKMIKELSSTGLGILVTDHNYRDLLSICDRTYFISEGRIVVEGDESIIRNHPIVKKMYLGTAI